MLLLLKQLYSVQAGTWTHAVNSEANIAPTVANGKVYVASNEQLQIFGLLPAGAHTEPSALAQELQPSQPDVVACPRPSLHWLPSAHCGSQEVPCISSLERYVL